LFALLFVFGALQHSSAQLFINEAMSSNNTALADNAGEFDDWIEIYNSGATAVNLATYFISDDPLNPQKWLIPSSNATETTVPAGGFLILWADQDITQGAHHIGFKISSLGETIVLTNPDGTTQTDLLVVPSSLSDHSHGRLPDGGMNTVDFFPSSPGASNNATLPTAAKPVLSPSGGAFSAVQTITISGPAGASIYYTLDGSDPGTSDFLYNGSFSVGGTTVVRAVAVQVGYNNSLIETQAYAIGESTNIPMVFLTTDPDNLFDDTNGIYCDGTNGTLGGCGVTTLVNYYQDWERPGNVTLIEEDGTVGFNKNMLVEVSGGCTRHLAKKSLNLKFDNNPDGDEINYKLFDTKDALTYSGFKLRNFGNWCWTRRIDDGLLHKLMENEIDLDMQSSRLASVYINGNYWGVYNIRDRTNKNFMKTHHPKVDEDNLDFIKSAKGRLQDVKQGDTVDYDNLVTFMLNNDLSIQSNYDYFKSQVDVTSNINYALSHIYYNARDWPGNNSIVYKEKIAGAKWRFISFDLDSYLTDPLGLHLFDYFYLQGSDVPGWKQDEPISTIYKRPMNNAEYKAEYFQKMRTLMETIWNPSNVLPIFNQLKNEMSLEIQSDLNRWENDFTYGYWLDANRYDLATWQTNVDDIYDFFVTRPSIILPAVESFLGSPGDFTLTFNTSASTNGYVALHTEYLKMDDGYSGDYFQNHPIRILAVPNPGYVFSHWQETGVTDAFLYQSYTSNTTLTPVFVAAADLVINEIFYNPSGSAETEEFIEIYNPASVSRDLRGYQLSDGVCFEFPEGAEIQPNEYILIAQDATEYAGNGYQVFQWEKTSLSNGGETVTISNPELAVIDSVAYDDGSGWPVEADGDGYSLALLDEALNNDLSANWKIQFGTSLTPGAKNQFCAAFAGSIQNQINVNCNGASTGFILAGAAGGNAPYTYSWNTGATGFNITAIPAGNYSVDITDAAGCLTTASTIVTEPPVLLSTASATDANCNGAASGSAQVTASGGTPGYTYSWSNGATTANVSGINAGSYTVTVSDSNGCQQSKNVTVGEPSAIALSDVHVDESVLGASDGVVNLAVTGGTMPYTYQWSNGATSQDISSLPGGTYTVVVVDANNCTANYSVTILPGTPPCTIPAGITAGNIQNTSATLSWTPDSNVSNYLVEYRESGFNSWTGFNSAYAFAILNNLNACTDYEVRIRASCASGMSSVYSAIYTFTTDGCVLPCSTITGLFSQNVTNSSGFLVWDIVPNATYTMYYRAVGNATWFSYPTQFPLAILFTLPACTDFEWYVEVNCISGQVSGPSPIANFTTIGANCKSILEDGIADGSIQNVQLYPNPVMDQFSLEFTAKENETVSIRIINTLGQIVFEKKQQVHEIENRILIDSKSLSSGNYICNLQSNNGIHSIPFVKH